MHLCFISGHNMSEPCIREREKRYQPLTKHSRIKVGRHGMAYRDQSWRSYRREKVPITIFQAL